MRKIVIIGLALIPSLLQADTSGLKFVDAWLKQLPPVVPVRAGYMQIRNPTKQNHEIIAIQSDAFERVEMHESRMQDGMMTMNQLNSLPLPAGGLVELKPGGKHLMLMNPMQSLQVGDRVDLVITFEDESSQRVSLEVRK